LAEAKEAVDTYIARRRRIAKTLARVKRTASMIIAHWDSVGTFSRS